MVFAEMMEAEKSEREGDGSEERQCFVVVERPIVTLTDLELVKVQRPDGFAEVADENWTTAMLRGLVRHNDGRGFGRTFTPCVMGNGRGYVLMLTRRTRL